YYQFLWNYWWIGFALGHGQSPLWTNYVFYPHVSNLSIHTLAAIWYPVYLLVNPLAGRIAALNLMVILGFSLSGLAMFAWLERGLSRLVLPGGRSATLVLCFAGGAAYAFSPYLMVHSSYTQLNLTPLWWFPLLLLLWHELSFPRRLGRPIAAMLLGLCVWGLFLSDLEWVVWVPFVVGPFALWTLWANRRRRAWLPILGWTACTLAIAGILCWIYPLSALAQVNLNPDEFPPAGMETLLHYSLPVSALVGLADYVEVRTLGHILVWIAWLAILLTLYGGWQTRRTGRMAAPAREPWPGPWLWLLFVIPPLVMALGPQVTIGSVNIPLPYLLLHNLLRGQHRVPSRFTGGTLALLITFIAVALYPFFVQVWRRRRLLATTLALLITGAIMYDAGAFWPFPTLTMPNYDLYQQIARDPRPYVVMDVPAGIQYGWTGIGRGYLGMYYSPIHKHPIVNGWLARIPYSTLAYYADQPLFSWLAGVQELTPAQRSSAGEQLDKLIRSWPIGYIIAHRDWMTPDQQNAWIGWLNTLSWLCPAQESPDAQLIWWQTRTLGCDQESPTTQVAVGASSDWTTIGEGWYAPEIVGGPQARWAGRDASLRFTVDPKASYELTFSALAFGSDRTVVLSSGGQSIGQPIALSDDDWHAYHVIIPAGAIQRDVLTLNHNGSASPEGADPRQLAAAYRSFSLRPLTEF
ncbi:MAG TPA: hypothetical protein VMT24_08080, partial [Aggregatilineaceae bacterium]|nr:hypothetical protein [Aggregatilineaceae bacterium]